MRIPILLSIFSMLLFSQIALADINITLNVTPAPPPAPITGSAVLMFTTIPLLFGAGFLVFFASQFISLPKNPKDILKLIIGAIVVVAVIGIGASAILGLI